MSADGGHTIAVVGGLALVGGTAMAMTNAPETGIGLVAVGGLLLMTIVMLAHNRPCLRASLGKKNKCLADSNKRSDQFTNTSLY
jgi:hypothetical protein